MPDFKYSAKDSRGQLVESTISRDSLEACVDEIRSKGLFLIKIEPLKAGKSNIFEMDMALLFKRSLPYKTLASITRTLSFMLKSSVAPDKALEILKIQTKKKYVRDIFDSMATNLVDGSTLSAEFRKNVPHFPSLISDLVEAGEATSQVDETLEEVANFYDKQANLKSTIITAMLYPTFIFLFAIGAVIFLITYALPAVAGMLERFDTELPAITKFLLGVSDVFTNYWYILIIGLSVGLFAFKRSMRVNSFKEFIDSLVFKLPVLSDLILKINLSRFTRTYSMLYESGAKIMDIALSSEKTIANLYLRRKISNSLKSLPDGVDLSTALNTVDLVPKTLIEIVKVGEVSATLGQGLKSIAEQYDRETEQTVKRLSSIIDPVLMLFVGAIVGVIVLAMFLPIFSLTDAVR